MVAFCILKGSIARYFMEKSFHNRNTYRGFLKLFLVLVFVLVGFLRLGCGLFKADIF